MELQVIQDKIYEIRCYRVMLDVDLAKLYGVQTKALKQAVRRNIQRFPADFMFELTEDEASDLRSQTVTSSWGGNRYLPFAFTEQGVAMLSSVLHSPTAIKVNISIMRAFVMVRQMAVGYDEILKRIEELEQTTDMQFNEIYQALTELAAKRQEQEKPRKPIGYKMGKASKD